MSNVRRPHRAILIRLPVPLADRLDKAIGDGDRTAWLRSLIERGVQDKPGPRRQRKGAK